MYTFLLIIIFIISAGIAFIGWAMLNATIDVENDQKEYLSKHLVSQIKDRIKAREVLNALIICLFFMSCNAPKHFQKIHGVRQSGTYTIKSFKNNTATFQEFPGQYFVPSDTLKKGDKIFITIVRPVKINKNAKDSKSTVQKTQRN